MSQNRSILRAKRIQKNSFFSNKTFSAWSSSLFIVVDQIDFFLSNLAVLSWPVSFKPAIVWGVYELPLQIWREIGANSPWYKNAAAPVGWENATNFSSLRLKNVLIALFFLFFLFRWETFFYNLSLLKTTSSSVHFRTQLLDCVFLRNDRLTRTKIL